MMTDVDNGDGHGYGLPNFTSGDLRSEAGPLTPKTPKRHTARKVKDEPISDGLEREGAHGGTRPKVQIHSTPLVAHQGDMDDIDLSEIDKTLREAKKYDEHMEWLRNRQEKRKARDRLLIYKKEVEGLTEKMSLLQHTIEALGGLEENVDGTDGTDDEENHVDVPIAPEHSSQGPSKPQQNETSPARLILDDAQLNKLLSAQGHQGGSNYAKISPIRYKEGQDWNSFQEQFLSEMSIFDIKPSEQLMYLRRAVPEAAQPLIAVGQVDHINDALRVLKSLYHQEKDVLEIQEDLMSIRQKEGESFSQLSGRLQLAVNKYDDASLGLSKDAKDKLLVEQFKRSIRDPKIREHVVASDRKSIKELIQVCTKYQRFYTNMDNEPKKSVRWLKDDRPASQPDISSIERDTNSLLAKMQTDLAKLRADNEKLLSRVSDLETKGSGETQGHGRSKGYRKGGQKWRNFDPSKATCFWCQEKGHIQNDCERRKSGLPRIPRHIKENKPVGQTGSPLNS